MVTHEVSSVARAFGRSDEAAHDARSGQPGRPADLQVCCLRASAGVT
jgi:hypothetical protein